MTRRFVYSLVAAVLIPAAVLAQAPGQKTPKASATKAPAAAPVRLVLAPAGNEARFIVREKLFANLVENDAIGATTAISGTLVLDARGKVDTSVSRFVVQLDSLKSDASRRDGYVKGRTLETRQFPTATLVIKDIQGLPAVLPTSGTLNVTIVGDFTVHGVTKPSTWTATVTADPNGFSGKATTHFKFEDFNMTQPSVPVLAHLNNDIKLEYDFRFVRQ